MASRPAVGEDAYAASKPPSAEEQRRLAQLQRAIARREPLGISFSGSGFFSPYHAGICDRLQELGIISSDTPVAGASASALIAVCLRAGVSMDTALQALKNACQDLLQNGSKRRMQEVMRREVQQLLPPDAHERCSRHVYLSGTHVHGPCPGCWRPEVLPSGYASREELVDAVLTSAYVPLQADGGLCTQYHRGRYVDGGLRLPVAPVPGVTYTIQVYALPAKHLTKRWPYRVLQHPPAPADIDIAPDKFGWWPLNYKQNSKKSMNPQPPEFLDALMERGRRDAQRWAEHVGLVGSGVAGDPPVVRRIDPSVAWVMEG